MKCLKKLLKSKHTHETKETTVIRVPTAATLTSMKIEVHGMENFTDKEKAKFMKAMLIGEVVLNSYDFRMRVCSSTFTEDRGMNGKHIWELICSGQDLYNANADKDIDVFVTMYHNFWTGNIGYTFPDTVKTWINRAFFKDFDEAEIFGNVIHEAMHNFGFDHKDYENRYSSVPYKVGYIARDLAKMFMKGQRLSPLPRN